MQYAQNTLLAAVTDRRLGYVATLEQLSNMKKIM